MLSIFSHPSPPLPKGPDPLPTLSSPAAAETKDALLAYEPTTSYPTLKFVSLGGLGISGFSNKTFMIRMTKSAQHTTSGAGALALATPVYPSTFLQYTQLSGLFNQVRIRSVRIQMVSNVNPNSSSGGSTTYAGGTLALAFLPRANSGASPSTTVTEVARAPGVKIYNPLTITAPVIVSFRYPKDTPWSAINSSASGLDPIDGNYGYFGHASIGNTLTASTAYTTYLIEAMFEFRAIQ